MKRGNFALAIRKIALAIGLLALAILACNVQVNNVQSVGNAPAATAALSNALAISEGLPTHSPTLIHARVTAIRSLNVRARPGIRAIVIDGLYSSDPVILTGTCQDGWAEIVWKDGRAWVNASYLSDNLCNQNEARK